MKGLVNSLIIFNVNDVQIIKCVINSITTVVTKWNGVARWHLLYARLLLPKRDCEME